MNKSIPLIAAGLLAAGPALVRAADVGVGVSIQGEIQPGVYGRVDIGNRPPPPVLYPQPVVIVKRPQPWSKHCHKYNACERPVYFVKSAEYEPGYEHPGKGRGKGKGRD